MTTVIATIDEIIDFPSFHGQHPIRVFIVYKPRPYDKSGKILVATDKKDVTEEFVRLVGEYYHELEKQEMYSGFIIEGKPVVVLTLGLIKQDLEKIRDLAEEIESLVGDMAVDDCQEAADNAREIQKVIEGILKMEKREGASP